MQNGTIDPLLLVCVAFLGMLAIPIFFILRGIINSKKRPNPFNFTDEEFKKIDEFEKDMVLKCEVCGAVGARYRSYEKVSSNFYYWEKKLSDFHLLCDKHKSAKALEESAGNYGLGVNSIIQTGISNAYNMKGGLDVTDLIAAEELGIKPREH